MLLYLRFTNTEKKRIKILQSNHEFIQWLTDNFLSFKLNAICVRGESYLLKISDEMLQWCCDYLTEQKILHQFDWFQIKKCDCVCHTGMDILHFESCCNFQGFFLIER